jgi:FADH2 O2-dependent halogenase
MGYVAKVPGCGLRTQTRLHVLSSQFGSRAAVDPERQDQLLVAASPHDAIADTHWYRADVDSFFVREAQNVGVDYLDEVRLENASELDEKVRLEGTRHGRRFAVSARFVVDATGPRGFLHRALACRAAIARSSANPGPVHALHRTCGVSTRSDGRGPALPRWTTRRFIMCSKAAGSGFCASTTESPAPALRPRTRSLNASDSAKESQAWQRLLASTSHRTRSIRIGHRGAALRPRASPLLPQRADRRTPLGATAIGGRFRGPLFFPPASRSSFWAWRGWRRSSSELGFAPTGAGAGGLRRQTEDELLATARLIGSLYATMANFPLFVSLSLLYFAAASFSETARRLGRPHLASSFLLHDHPAFQIQSLLARARNQEEPQG